jgi:hypothetical protein
MLSSFANASKHATPSGKVALEAAAEANNNSAADRERPQDVQNTKTSKIAGLQRCTFDLDQTIWVSK